MPSASQPNGPSASSAEGSTAPSSDGQARLWQAGRTSWSLIGILAVLVVAGFVLSSVPLVVVPLLLALFPATLLEPVVHRLKRMGAPPALAAIVGVLGTILLVVGALVVVVTLVVAQAPELVESAGEGIGEIEEFLEDDPLGIGLTGLSEIVDAAADQLGEIGELAPQAISAAVLAFEFVAGLVLLLIAMFFYLKDGRRLTEGVLSMVPGRFRGRTRGIADRAWDTLGSYFRGQMLVALVDAVFIGIGLLILGVPLAVPLSVLIFFGGLFPIVGAVATGTLAVLVALADSGLTAGLIVLGLILAVQQLESNVLEPIILGRAIHLHPLVVLVAITAGGVTLGILGAFLAVPVAAVIAEAIDYLRSGEDPVPPPPGYEDPDAEDSDAADRPTVNRSGVGSRRVTDPGDADADD